MNKKIIIIAGPNGAGKTTFARSFLPAEARCPRFINADLIAAGLSPFAPEAAAIKAGRLMLQEIAHCAAHGESFAFETTLSGLTYLRHIQEWKGLGYHIPEDVIRRRYVAGRHNFETHYRDVVDAWACYDNSGDEPIMIKWGERA